MHSSVTDVIQYKEKLICYIINIICDLNEFELNNGNVVKNSILNGKAWIMAVEQVHNFTIM